MHALMGSNRFALDALVEAVDEGVRDIGYIEISPFLEPIRNSPEYAAAVEVARQDLAVQAERIRAMQESGELPTLPPQKLLVE